MMEPRSSVAESREVTTTMQWFDVARQRERDILAVHSPLVAIIGLGGSIGGGGGGDAGTAAAAQQTTTAAVEYGGRSLHSLLVEHLPSTHGLTLRSFNSDVQFPAKKPARTGAAASYDPAVYAVRGVLKASWLRKAKYDIPAVALLLVRWDETAYRPLTHSFDSTHSASNIRAAHALHGADAAGQRIQVGAVMLCCLFFVCACFMMTCAVRRRRGGTNAFNIRVSFSSWYV
jgi:hypothetical protein